MRVWRATCAAAPATTTSSRRSWPRPRHLSHQAPGHRHDRGRDSAPAPVVGTRRLRREDPALLTGEARFVDDLVIPGALHMAVVRSQTAHARIRSVDISAARSQPGVVAAFSGADLRDEWAGPMPCAWPVTADMNNPEHLPVAVDKACYVGDAVAVVLAETDYAAKDAAETGRRRLRGPARGHRSRGCALRPGRDPRRTRDQQELHVGAEPGSGRGGAGVRRGRPHRRRDLLAAAADPVGHGAPRSGGGARALRRGLHGVLGHPDPPHPPGHAGPDGRCPRDQAPGRGARRSAAASAPSSTSTPRSCCAWRWPGGSSGRCAGPRSAARTPRRRSRAGARSSTSSWPPTSTAGSPRCGSSCWPTWAPTSSW